MEEGTVKTFFVLNCAPSSQGYKNGSGAKAEIS
jgi:hypothetical protein